MVGQHHPYKMPKRGSKGRSPARCQRHRSTRDGHLRRLRPYFYRRCDYASPAKILFVGRLLAPIGARICRIILDRRLEGWLHFLRRDAVALWRLG
jgi:hypothetical protein